MESKKSNVFVSLGLHIIGFLFCVVPPAICTLNYFPLWKKMGYESCIAGGVALLLAICAIPLYKLITKWLQSFSSYILWLAMFIMFFGLAKIADQMTVISLVGFIGNLIGAVCFYLGRKFGKKGKE